MKKILILLVVIFISFGCARENSSVDVYEKVMSEGVMSVAMEGTWSPWTYHDENDKLVGFDTEIAEEIGRRLGVSVNFVEGEWDGLLAGLSAGRYDLMINGIDITEDRKKSYDFSEPYAYMRTAIIVNSDNDTIKSFSDLKGKKTANTISSTYAQTAESFGADVVAVDDLTQTFELLNQNRVDATLNAEVTYYDYVKTQKDNNVKIAALSDEANLVGIAFKKGNKKMVDAVNEILVEMQSDGTLKKISLKYFGVDVTK